MSGLLLQISNFFSVRRSMTLLNYISFRIAFGIAMSPWCSVYHFLKNIIFSPTRMLSYSDLNKLETTDPPLFFICTTFVSYLILIVIGHIRDFFGAIFYRGYYKHILLHNGYAPLNDDFEEFYIRRLKARINDCFSRPICSTPGRTICLLDRVSYDNNQTFQLTGLTINTLNMSSYNYLGFAQSTGHCADAVESQIMSNGVSMCSPVSECGASELLVSVEQLVANFVGKPSAIVFSMGFATNSVIIPSLVGKGCLIVSDQLNHSSIRNGSRLSGAVIRMFRHNDMYDLESLLQTAITEGQPGSNAAWKMILVIVEGLYSMEGTICKLPDLVTLKKKYKFYLFIDEAHSIGALGASGRGVCDFFNINPSDVDVLMGTLTKSFGANGGYIAGETILIKKLMMSNAASLIAEAPSPPVLCQIYTALKIVTGDIVPSMGATRIRQLRLNSLYLRRGLIKLGLSISGDEYSPIIPIMLYNPAKMSAFSHEMLRRKISVVVVGYPATPLLSSRARLCVSAAHTQNDLDTLLCACNDIGDILQLKYAA